jgi:serine protease
MHISHLIGGSLGAALVALAAASPALAATDAPMVNGLIVQLRDAPSHVALGRERSLAAADGAPTQLREQARWKSVVSAMPSLRIAERRAVGESAQLMRFERPMTAAQAQAVADQLAQRPEVQWAAPNTRERRLQAAPPAGGPPGDPRYSEQWWLQLPGAGSNGAPNYLTAWTTATTATTGDPNSLVAVLDNGIVPHPDLAGKVVNGYDMVSDPVFSNDRDGRDADASDPGDWVDAADLQRQDYKDFNCQLEPSSWHGTAIAGMLAATVNNSQGGASMNWPGRVLAVRVAAKCGADVSDIVDGIRWVAGLSVCLRTAGAAGAHHQHQLRWRWRLFA